ARVFSDALPLAVILRTVLRREGAPRLPRLSHTIARLLDSNTSPVRLIPVLLGMDLFRLLPGHPTSRLKADMDREIYTLIAQRRAAPTRGDDGLSLLLAARDDDGKTQTDHQLRAATVTRP